MTFGLALFAAALSAIAAAFQFPSTDAGFGFAAALVSVAIAVCSSRDSRRNDKEIAMVRETANKEIAAAREEAQRGAIQAEMNAIEMSEIQRHSFGS